MVELLLKQSNLLEIDDNFIRYINTCFALRYSLCTSSTWTSQHCLLWFENGTEELQCLVWFPLKCKNPGFFFYANGGVCTGSNWKLWLLLLPLPVSAGHESLICMSCKFNFHSPSSLVGLRKGFAVGRTDGQDAQRFQYDERLGHPHAAATWAEAAWAWEISELHPKVWHLHVLCFYPMKDVYNKLLTVKLLKSY